MPLQPGTRLGPYVIAAPIGSGGMGEVYRARDTRLERDVALKVLPASVADEPDRLDRFTREARVLASLNDPHIAHIHGLDESGPVRALVMELVEGPTLADRIAKGPLPLDDALPIAIQIAQALEAAHDQGIVHRDLKPANVKVRPDGAVKVLDFGLAKALGAAAMSGAAAVGGTAPLNQSNSPTALATNTRVGVILGTAAYMAPEQAKGKAVDRRADIWAFGVVLYEMLSGRRAFDGETVTDVIAAVVTREPDWSALPPDVPTRLGELLRRCLEKDPQRRLRDAGDLRLLLEETDDSVPGVISARAGAGTISRVPSWLPWALAGVLAGVAIAGWYLVASQPAAPPRTLARLSARLPTGVALDVLSDIDQHQILAVSPDGARLVFVGISGGVRRLYLRALERLDATPIAGTEEASTPFFSPDGRWIGFFARGKLKKVAVAGGDPIELCDVGLNRGAAWGPDGTIVFTPTTTTPVMAVSSGGGAPRELTHLDPSRRERTHRWPTFMPGGQEVAFTVGTADKPGAYEDAEVDAVALATGKRRVLLRGASMVRFTSSGDMLLGRGSQIFAMPLRAADGSAATTAVPVLQDVAGVSASGVLFFDVATNGTLVYAEQDPGATQLQLAWVSPSGVEETLPLPPREYRVPRISPDGKRIAVAIGPGGGRASDIWIDDLASGTLRRLTFDGNSDVPVWSPDGLHVTYGMQTASGNRLAWKRADGDDAGQTLVSFRDSAARAPLAWTRDSSMLVFEQDGGAGHGEDLMVFQARGAAVRPFVQTPAIEMSGALSPDGRWLAYVSDEAGQAGIYVQSFPSGGGRWQIAETGFTPCWSRDGRELYYVDQGKMFVVPVQPGPSFAFGPPRVLFTASIHTSDDLVTNYDVGPDGRFITVVGHDLSAGSSHLNVVLNWLDEVRRVMK